MFQATRRRLALWYTAVTAVLLLLFASGVYLYVRSTLIERIDDTLNHVLEVVERSLVIEKAYPDASQLRINIEATFRDNADAVEDDHIDLEWFSPGGELLWSTLSEPLNIPIHPNRTGETIQVVRDAAGSEEYFSSASHELARLRQVTQRVEIERQLLGYLRVSHPWFEVTKPIQQLIVDLSLGTGLMLLSVAASGWFLSGKAMEPVRESYQRLKQFTADASHELRSPIALIQTNVQVALTDPEPELQNRQHLKVVERLTQRLGRLVDDLLFLARQDSGIVQKSFSACPLDALLMEVIEEQNLIAAERNVTLFLNLIDPPNSENAHASSGSQSRFVTQGCAVSITDVEESLDWFTTQGDWDQLARLFTNLIGNAVQCTPDGGKVCVELQRKGGVNHVYTRRYGAYILQVKIIDTGIGIPESALPHLFDRFYRVDPARTRGATTLAAKTPTGSGLGLAIAAAIVESHQGQIQVESTLHRGTTFTVTLPLSVDKSQATN